MKPSGRRPAALLLLWLLTPGPSELGRDLWHLAWDGHTAHAAEHAADEPVPVAPEHGCSGAIHVCACHTTTPFDVTSRLFGAGRMEPCGRVADGSLHGGLGLDLSPPSPPPRA